MNVAIVIAAVVAALSLGTVTTNNTVLGGPSGAQPANTGLGGPGLVAPTSGTDNTVLGGPG